MPDAIITKATIVNWALIELGQPANFSIDTENALGGIVDLCWTRVVDRTFGLHDWTFCRRTAKLTRKEATPVTGWAYAFDMPGDKVGDPLKVTVDPACEAPLRNYHLEGTELHANEATVYVRCRVLVDPQYWDPAFRDAFTIALAAQLAVPLLQSIELRDDMTKSAFGTPSQGGTGGAFGRLIAQNRAAAPLASPLLRNDPLSDARLD